MSDQDKYSLPLHMKVEREGEPRGIRRGPTKRKNRHKGVKARMDQILSAFRQVKREAEWVVAERRRKAEHPERYSSNYFYLVLERRFDQYNKKLMKLVAGAVKDGVISEQDALNYVVLKP